MSSSQSFKALASPLTRGAWIEIPLYICRISPAPSPLTRGAWIEIFFDMVWNAKRLVAPHTRGVD